MAERIPLATVQGWLMDALRSNGGRTSLKQLIAEVEHLHGDELPLQEKQPQKGHEHESRFSYRCRWAVTGLGQQGALSASSPRGMIELSGDEASQPQSKQLPGLWDTDHEEPTNKAPRSAADRAFVWLSSQPRGAYHYRDGVWRALAAQFPDQFGVTKTRKTPWSTVCAAILGDPRFRKAGRGRFGLQSWGSAVSSETTAEDGASPGGPADMTTNIAVVAAPGMSGWYAVQNLDTGNYLLTPTATTKATRDPGRAADLARRWARGGPKLLAEQAASLALAAARASDRPVAETRPRVGASSRTERNRRLLRHLVRFGELAPQEVQELGLTAGDVDDWVAYLLIARPRSLVVSPLFLSLLDAGPTPAAFTMQLASALIGEKLESSLPLAELETYIWDRFGGWHLPEPNVEGETIPSYLVHMVTSSPALAAQERLELFARLGPSLIASLVGKPDFAGQMSKWSAEGAQSEGLGPLSRQLYSRVRRPLFLTDAAVPEPGLSDGEPLEALSLEDTRRRLYIASGLGLRENDGERLDSSQPETLERVLTNPLYGCIIQLEVHRLFSGVSGQVAAALRRDGAGEFEMTLPSGAEAPLWRFCRKALEAIGYWSVGMSAQDATWAEATRTAIANMTRLGMMKEAGGKVELSEVFASRIRANPDHAQNRGEKPFRCVLLTHLQGTEGRRP